MYGSIIHHTASADSDTAVEICFSGRPDLSGPLCAGVIRKDGTVHLVGGGRANHAGMGSSATLAAVKAGGLIPSLPGPDDMGGNTSFYGWELTNRGDGVDPWPEAQVTAAAKVCAALARHHGWTAQHSIAHREWTKRKIDPKGIDMSAFRSRVAALISAAVKPPAPSGPAYPGHLIKYHSTDHTNVKVIQRRLNAIRNARLTVDGGFGPKTLAAVESFQRSRHLADDGIVGPRTWGSMWS
jgi:peptidoglycan hydrolase-like protein with peptidoglycan-binding domain